MMSQKEENEGGLVGALKYIKDKGIALQSLAAEHQAAMQLAKQRENDIQNLKTRLSLTESRIKDLMLAEANLLKDKEELLKEIEVLGVEVDRSKEGSEFARENQQLDEEIRRLKCFFEEGERERMDEQITILQNKLLEALERKSVHESGPSTVQERMKSEQEEKVQKWNEQADKHLYTNIKVARNEDLIEQIGNDICFDLVDHEKVKCFRVQKKMPFNRFKEEVVKEFGVPVQYQRFWLWAERQNLTYRPDRLLTPLEESRPVGRLRKVSNKEQNRELNLFLEVQLGSYSQPVLPPAKKEDDILLFFKHYNPEKQELRYVGRLIVKRTGKPADILTKLKEMAGYAFDEEIELYEEIKFEPTVMCISIDRNITFRQSELEDGDIVFVQKAFPAELAKKYLYPDVPSFLQYVRDCYVCP